MPRPVTKELPDGTPVRVTFKRSGDVYPASPNGAELLAKVKAGSRVTILTPQGQKRTGRAVMRSSVGGWALNMGGKHGTPGLVDERNIVSVSGGGDRARARAEYEADARRPGGHMVNPHE